MTKTPAPRKQLSADALYRTIYQSFQDLPDPRTGEPTITLPDALMSGFAMFALKDPSMLAFDERRQRDEKNLQMIFRHISFLSIFSIIVTECMDAKQKSFALPQAYAKNGQFNSSRGKPL